MSGRKRTSRTRGSGRIRGRRMWLPTNGDLSSLSLLAMLAANTPRAKKKTTTSNKRGTPRTRVAAATANQAQCSRAEVISIEDTPESNRIMDAVQSKMGDFMQSGSFISSDEDEAESKSNRQAEANVLFISDDSDDEFKMGINRKFDNSGPSTSTGACSSGGTSRQTLDDSVMEIVDSVLGNEGQIEQNNLQDMKTLEEYRKETEEILKNASTLLNEIATVRSEPKVTEPPNKTALPVIESPEKVTIGCCPICLESLADRAASVTVCGHIFCKECIMVTATSIKKCPTCRKPISAKKIHPIYF